MAAPAQTLKPLTALLLAHTAAAANAQMHLGSALLVSLTRPLEPDSGMICLHPALLTAAAARVSYFEVKVVNVLFVEFNSKDCNNHTGVLISPNHPKSYPRNLERRDTIQVESGKMLRLEFTHFQVYPYDTATCPSDYVKIVDGDGTTLMERGCGYSTGVSPSHSWFFLPPIFTTKTNAVNIFFYTDSSGTAAGWSLKWMAVTPGLPPHLTLVSSRSVTLP